MYKKQSKRRLTAEAVTFDSAGRVLLVKQGSAKRGWELPGGKLKRQESPASAVMREVKEEAGVDVLPERLIGIFYIPAENTFDFVMHCRLVENGVLPKPNPPETVECGFFSVDKLPRDIAAFTLDRIHDALEGIVHPLPVDLERGEWLK